MAYKTYVLGSIARLDVETMHHFEADVRFIRASEEYRIVGRHPDPDRTSAVGYQGIRFGLPTRCPTLRAFGLAFVMTSQLCSYRLNIVQGRGNNTASVAYWFDDLGLMMWWARQR